MKLKQPILYMVFGGLTTVVNLLIYQLAISLKTPYTVANGLAFIAAVLFAYVTNKHFVFESHARKFAELLREICKFFTARIGTFFIETLGLWFMIDLLGMDTSIPKYIMTVAVVVLNYFLSKWYIFKGHQSM